MKLSSAAMIALAAFALVCGQLRADDSLKLKAGDNAPDFKATATDGKEVSLETVKDAEVVVLVFTCNQCPVAVAYEDRINDLAKKYKDQKVELIAINNSKNENVEQMKERAEKKGFKFTYAYEGDGESARDYGAKVTPHVFVLDKERKLVYQGALDNNQKNPTEHFVADVLDSTLKGDTIEVNHRKAFGCTIKFREAVSTK